MELDAIMVIADKDGDGEVDCGLYPIVTSQYISTTLYQFPYHIQ